MEVGNDEETDGTASDLDFAPQVSSDDEDDDHEADGDRDDPPGGSVPCRGRGRGGRGGRDRGRGGGSQRQRAIDKDLTQEMPTNDLPQFGGRVGVKEGLSTEFLMSPARIFVEVITEDLLRQTCAQTNLYFYQCQADNLQPPPNQRPWDNLTVPEL